MDIERSRTASEDGDIMSTGSMAGLENLWSSGSGTASGLRTHALKCVNTLSGHHSGIRVIAVLNNRIFTAVSYTHLRAHETLMNL
eukprot:6268159-Prymnesium_polylepis.1